MNEQYINEIVASVIKTLETKGAIDTKTSQKGVFDTMTEALEAVSKAYKQYREYTVAQREKMIANIRKLTLEEAGIMAEMGVEETGMGRV